MTLLKEITYAWVLFGIMRDNDVGDLHSELIQSFNHTFLFVTNSFVLTTLFNNFMSDFSLKILQLIQDLAGFTCL